MSFRDFKNVGLYIPKTKLTTGNLEEALNFFLAQLGIKNARFDVGIFKNKGTLNFGIVLRNTLFLREPINSAFSMLTVHTPARVPVVRCVSSFPNTLFDDWYLWKDYPIP